MEPISKYVPLIQMPTGHIGMNARIMGVKNRRENYSLPDTLLIETPNGDYYDKRTLERVDFPAGKPPSMMVKEMDVYQPPVIIAPPKITPIQQATREFFAEKTRQEAVTLQSENIRSQQLGAPVFGVLNQRRRANGIVDPLHHGQKGFNGFPNAAESRPGTAGMVDVRIRDQGDALVQSQLGATHQVHPNPNVIHTSPFVGQERLNPLAQLNLQEQTTMPGSFPSGPSNRPPTFDVQPRQPSQVTMARPRRDSVVAREGNHRLATVAEPIIQTAHRIPTGLDLGPAPMDIVPQERARYRRRKPQGLSIVPVPRTPGRGPGDVYPHLDFRQSADMHDRYAMMSHALDNINRDFPPVYGYDPSLPFRGPLLQPLRRRTQHVRPEMTETPRDLRRRAL